MANNFTDREKEYLINLISKCNRIVLCQPLDNGKEFPDHDWVRSELDDWTYRTDTNTLELYNNPGYEV
jgi:hypothetical protein